MVIDKIEQKGPGQKGFTLLELVLTMTILGILAVGANLFMNPITDLMVQKNFSEGLGGEAKLALMRMVREMTQIRSPTSVTTAQNNSFSFTDANNNAIAYTLNSGNLLRNNIRMAMGVTSLVFTYYDVNNNTISTPSVNPNETNIALIQIVLTVSDGTNTATFRSQARPRNLFT